MKLNEFFRQKGLGSQLALARAIGAWQPDLSAWASEKKPVPHHRCLQIEKATGGLVTRKDLRPNDWSQMWPELADVE